MHIDATDLVKRYGTTTALDLPSLTIASGSLFGLVGNNGAGKTTFLRLVLDLIEATFGTVCIDGVPVTDATTWKPRTGAFLDDSFLIDYLTPEEYFAFIGDVYGLRRPQVDAALERYGAFFNGEVLGRGSYIRDLSVGNKKKVGIVAALLPEPGLLLLDEPFANLDPSTQIRLKTLLRRSNAACGTTVVVSSHDLNHVTEVCGRIAVLERGRIVRDIETSPATLADLERYFAVEEDDAPAQDEAYSQARASEPEGVQPELPEVLPMLR